MEAWSLTFSNPVPYNEGLLFQYKLLEARQKNIIPDTILLMQHKPVVTIGNRGRTNYLLKTKEEYKQLGIDFFKIERGGDVTFHGPGQWVLYPILHLGSKDVDSHGYLYNLEEIAIRVLKSYNIKGFRREGKSGAWTELGKIAAIGFRLKKWITFHGMSFNVLNNLEGFNTIIPCGLVDEPITSLDQLLVENISMNEVGKRILNNFSTVCERSIVQYKDYHNIPKKLLDLNPPILIDE